MPDPRDFLPPPPWEGPPIPRVLTIREDLREFARWMERHQRSPAGIMPRGRIWRLARELNLLYTNTVYRGIGWWAGDYPPYEGPEPIGKVEKGKKVKVSGVTSWSKDTFIASRFIVFPHSYSFLLMTDEDLKYYSKERNRVGVLLAGKIYDGIDLDKAEEVINRTGIWGSFVPSEGEVIGKVDVAIIMKYVDWRV